MLSCSFPLYGSTARGSARPPWWRRSGTQLARSRPDALRKWFPHTDVASVRWTDARLRLRNYRSITEANVRLGDLLLLVGSHGVDVLDVLRLLSEALQTSLDQALRARGGVAEVRRRSTSRPDHFGTDLEFHGPASVGSYGFEVGAVQGGGFRTTREGCRVRTTGEGQTPHGHFKIRSGKAGRTVTPVHCESRKPRTRGSSCAETAPKPQAFCAGWRTPRKAVSRTTCGTSFSGCAGCPARTSVTGRPGDSIRTPRVPTTHGVSQPGPPAATPCVLWGPHRASSPTHRAHAQYPRARGAGECSGPGSASHRCRVRPLSRRRHHRQRAGASLLTAR